MYLTTNTLGAVIYVSCPHESVYGVMQALAEANKLKREMELLRGTSYLRCLNTATASELEHLPIQQLKTFESVLIHDLDSLKRVSQQRGHSAFILNCFTCSNNKMTELYVRVCR